MLTFALMSLQDCHYRRRRPALATGRALGEALAGNVGRAGRTFATAARALAFALLGRVGR